MKIAMPEFSNKINKKNLIKSCKLAEKEFEEFRTRDGYKKGDLPWLAFVQKASDEFGTYFDYLFFDHSGSYILRQDIHSKEIIFKKQPNENEISFSLPLSQEEMGSLWGEYQSLLPIKNKLALKKREKEFYQNTFSLE